MKTKRKVAIVGYGNIGKYAIQALAASPDFELAGIVRRAASLQKKTPPELEKIPLVASIQELEGVEAAILSTPTRLTPNYAKEILNLGINTVDSYDIHVQLVEVKEELDKIARKNNCTAIISAGWDPGTDSIIRGIFELMAPKGITNTNFGPGMSMGHSVAARAIAGVENALAMTIPIGAGKHRRMVYVQLKPEADFEKIKKAVLDDPYFINDETHIIETSNVEQLIDVGHGVAMERKGVSGQTHNQYFKYEMSINNPALTAQILVASVRASFRQQPGAYTTLEIPIIDFLPGNRKDLLKRLV